MKTTILMATAAIMNTMMSSTALADSADRNVIVCFDTSAATSEVAYQAERIASQMFRDIAVRLEWHEAGHFCQTHDRVIAISLSIHTPSTLLPGVLAYAQPFEGIHIQVFYDRLFGPDGVNPSLLAHVLVHEITHILQGTDHHSATGIMMAHWSQAQRLRMKTMPLTFTRQDVDLVYQGLAARAAAARVVAAR